MKKGPTLLLLAGGSAFSFLDFIETEVFSPNITIAMGDERYDRDEKVNNFTQLSKTQFYKTASASGAHFFDSHVQKNESFEEFGDRFEKNIQRWLIENPEGTIVATFGVGEDGHTAGILPFPENPEHFKNLFEKNPTSVIFDAGTKNQFPFRATVTLPFIRTKIQSAIVYCIGEKKREALTKISAPEGKIWETPARVLREIKDVSLFTDIV